MRLIVICQAVDARSSTLGFFIEWLKELSRQCETIEVISFKVGGYDLPPNVHVHDARAWGGSAIARYARCKLLLLKLLPKADGVFVHMSPEYAIVAAPIAAFWGKPVVLWYAHRSVTLRLRLAEKLVKHIVTSAGASFNLASRKVLRIGQGIPTDVFRPMTSGERGHRVMTVGRITPIKQIALMIEALALVRATGIPATLDLFGEAVLDEDKAYEKTLRELVVARGLGEAVRFSGAVAYAEFPVRYASYALALNMAPTGAPDKSVFEAMACGVPVVVVNETFRALLGPDASACVAGSSPADIASKMHLLLNHRDEALATRLRNQVIEHHSLKRLIRGIIESYVAD